MSQPTGEMALRGLTQLRVALVTADTTGGGTTYGTPKLVEAPQILSHKPVFVEGQQLGGDTVYDEYVKQTHWEVEIQFGALPLDVYAMMLGLDAPVDGGADPNRYQELELGEMRPPMVKLEGRVDYVGQDSDGQDYLFQGWKGKVVDQDAITHQQNGYVDVKFKMRFIKRKSDGKFGKLLHRETESVLTESVDTTPPTVTSGTPSANATGVALNAAISVTFSEAIQFVPAQFSLYKIDGGQLTDIDIVPTYNSGTHVVTYNQVVLDMENEKEYGMSAKAVKDTAGNVLAAEFTRTFTTAAA